MVGARRGEQPRALGVAAAGRPRERRLAAAARGAGGGGHGGGGGGEEATEQRGVAGARRLADEFGECRRRQPREARAGVDERGGERRRAARRGVAERRAPALVDVVGGRAAREQPARDVGVAGGGGAAELRPRVDQPEHRRVHLRVVVAVRALAQPAEHVEPPFHTARSSGDRVRRRLLGALRVGALAEQPLQTWRWPMCAAFVAGVRPRPSTELTSAPWCTSHCAARSWPANTAHASCLASPATRFVGPARSRLQRSQRLGVAARRRLAEGRRLGSVHGCASANLGAF